MTWHPEGLFRKWGVIDFAGGTVVHMSAGLAALSGALFLGKRKKIEEKPANIPFVILGTGLLWFGWFGFNAGSALGANFDAVVAFANTNLASATSMITWIFYDRFTNRKMTAIGACIGAIVGLVAITPAAGVVTLGQSIFIGFIAALISNISISAFRKLNIDDTLDVFPESWYWRNCGYAHDCCFCIRSWPYTRRNKNHFNAPDCSCHCGCIYHNSKLWSFQAG